MSHILSLDELLAPPTLVRVEEYIPELNGSVVCQQFTKGRQQELRDMATLKGNTNGRKAGEIDNNMLEILMVVHGVIEPKLSIEHVGRLKQQSASVIDRILKVILRINGLSEEAQQAAAASFPQNEGHDQRDEVSV
jgi:hypothetical protein